MKNVQIANAKLIYEASRNNKLVIIVGSGVSKNSDIPIWNELLQELKKDLPESIEHEYDALKIAQLYKNTFGFRDTIEKVKKVLNCSKAKPNKIHKVLFQMNPCHIITTNYDNLLEVQALANGEPFSTIRRDSDIPYADYNRYIIKMHGDFVDNNIVLTEDDYLNYSKNFPLISSIVQSIFASKTVLCVGYSFSDPDLKMLLNTVKGVLKQDTPRVFLLGNYSNDIVNERYLQDQGVYPIWIEEEILLKNDDSEEYDLSQKGTEVYRQLNTINNGFNSSNDIIDELYEIFSEITPQMPYLTLGLKELIPSKFYKVFNLHSTGLQLESTQIQEITQIISSQRNRGIRNLIKGRVDKVHYLLNFAWRNGIYEIDELNLYKLSSFKRFLSSYRKDTIDYLFEFDYPKVHQILHKLQNQPLSYNSHDLELPFVYWCLGYYTKAFLRYQELSTEYAKTSTPILYFICLHNQRMLTNAVRFENIGDNLYSLEHKTESIQKLDFSKLIYNLNIPEQLRTLFIDIANFGIFLDVVTDTKELERKLLENKLLADNGGWSSNSHIPLMVSKVERIFDFGNVNFLITTNNKYYQEVFKSGIAGLLLSHTIKERESDHVFAQSRLEEVDRYLVVFMIFAVESTTLGKIFKDHNIESVTLSKESVLYLETCIDNISTASASTNWDSAGTRKYIKIEKFTNQFSNLMLICLKATNQISNINKLVDILINNSLINWRDDAPSKNFRLLLEEEKIDLTEEQANTIFELFHPEDWGERPLTTVSDYMRNHGLTLSNNDVSFLREHNDRSFNAAAVVYPIATRAIKEQIEKWILESDFSKINQNCWRVFWGIAKCYCDNIITQPTVDAYLQFRQKNMKSNTDCEIVTSQFIAAIAKSECINGIVKTSMDTIADPLYQFLMNPNSVANEKVNSIWVFYLNDESLKDYLTIPEHKSVIRELIEKNDANAKYLAKRVNKIFLA